MPKKWVAGIGAFILPKEDSVPFALQTCKIMLNSNATRGLLSAFFILFSATVWGQTESQPCPNPLLTATGDEVILPALDLEQAWERAEKEEATLGKISAS